MPKTIKNADVYKMASDFKAYVEKNKKIPYTLSYSGVTYYGNEMQYILNYALRNPKDDVWVQDGLKWCVNATGTDIVENVLKDDYKDQAERVHKYIVNNKQIPNNVTTVRSKMKVNIDLYSYCVAKILVWMKNNNGAYPNYCKYDYKDMKSQSKTYTEEIFDYFSSKFGKPTSIDNALAKIKSKGYGYYYDDRYTNKQSIDRIKNGQGVNCTDACHLFWHIGKALGYDVKAIHVKCRGGDGHIRLQFYKKQYGWFNRDPASVLDGECVECIWCGNGTYLATNPQWFMQNVNR